MNNEAFLKQIEKSFDGITRADHPAHPVEMVNPTDGCKAQVFGLTKREEFAKAAMQGLLANGRSRDVRGLLGPRAFNIVTEQAVLWANDLIEALNEKGEKDE